MVWCCLWLWPLIDMTSQGSTSYMQYCIIFCVPETCNRSFKSPDENSFFLKETLVVGSFNYKVDDPRRTRSDYSQFLGWLYRFYCQEIEPRGMAGDGKSKYFGCFCSEVQGSQYNNTVTRILLHVVILFDSFCS